MTLLRVTGLVTLVSLLASCSDGSNDNFMGNTYFVDCSADVSGDGSSRSPWSSLNDPNEWVLQAGEQLLFRRGTTCHGMLKPLGGGSSAEPVLIGAYGEGPLPHIAAQGLHRAAILIEDVSHLIVRDLELTNPGNLSEPHSGIYLLSVEAKVENIVLRDLHIHDVTGLVTFNGTAKRGGGITSDSRFDTTETQFDGILIENNLIEDVGRSGIYFDGTSASTSARPRAFEPWPAGGQNIVIRGNTLRRLQGDAIVAHGTSGALIEHNVVDVGNLAGRDWQSAERNCSAGIWTWNSINTVIQYNEVSNYRFGQSATDGCDGTGFDIDNEQEGTIIQYNYSYNNEGGFILLCSDDEPHTGIVRYNLSVDDGKVLNLSPCKFPIVGTFDDIQVHNNTFVMSRPHAALETITLNSINNAGDMLFANNIVYATTAQTEPMACGDNCSNNLFFNLPPSGDMVVVGEPLFEDVDFRGPGRVAAGEAFKLRAGSPAIAAGMTLPESAPGDYFGTDIPANPAIGMHQPH